VRAADNAEITLRASRPVTEDDPGPSDEQVRAARDAATADAITRQLAGLSGQIGELAQARQAEQHAAQFDPEMIGVQLQETIAREDAEQALRQLRDAARNTKEWQARRRYAIEAAEHGLPQRELPPGFGRPLLDATGAQRLDANGRVMRRYPLGHQSRFVRLGDVPVSDTAGTARQVASALPAADLDLNADIQAQVVRFIEQQGRHEFIRRLLYGTLEFTSGTGAQRRVTTVTLDLGDLRDAHLVQGLHSEGIPIGTNRHHAVEADQQTEYGSRRTYGSTRTFSVTGNALTPFGALPGKAWAVTLGAVLLGSSGVEYESGAELVTAVKRAPRYEGMTAYFDLPGAGLLTTVVGGAAAAPRSGRTDLTARAAFPEELAPEKAAGDPPGAAEAT